MAYNHQDFDKGETRSAAVVRTGARIGRMVAERALDFALSPVGSVTIGMTVLLLAGASEFVFPGHGFYDIVNNGAQSAWHGVTQHFTSAPTPTRASVPGVWNPYTNGITSAAATPAPGSEAATTSASSSDWVTQDLENVGRYLVGIGLAAGALAIGSKLLPYLMDSQPRQPDDH